MKKSDEVGRSRAKFLHHRAAYSGEEGAKPHAQTRPVSPRIAGGTDSPVVAPTPVSAVPDPLDVQDRDDPAAGGVFSVPLVVCLPQGSPTVLGDFRSAVYRLNRARCLGGL